MATRAEQYRADTERRAQANTARPAKRPQQRQREAAQAAREALVERADGRTGGVPHNAAARAAPDSSYELEATRSGRPSRKSTRKSPTHRRADAGLRVREILRQGSPGTRATQRGL
jgi:hypothetical protein